MVAETGNKLVIKLFAYLKKNGISVPAFSSETGIPKDRIYKWKQEGTNPKAEDERILQNWLINKVEKIPHEIKEPEPYYKRRLALKNNSKASIPVYEASPATLTAIDKYRDDKNDNPDFWITIPQLRDCNYGTRATGDSMHPLIRTNAIVIGREITDLSVIVFGEIYIIHTKNGMETIKYIHPKDGEKETLLLVPYNEKAKVTPIHKSDIIKIFQAKAVFNTI